MALEEFGRAATAAVTYETYKALPAADQPYTQHDMDLMAEILAAAEQKAQHDADKGIGSGGLSLLGLLKGYEQVLAEHGIPAEEDTYYYRLLLKLTLDPHADWWAKLQREADLNARKRGEPVPVRVWAAPPGGPPPAAGWPSVSCASVQAAGEARLRGVARAPPAGACSEEGSSTSVVPSDGDAGPPWTAGAEAFLPERWAARELAVEKWGLAVAFGRTKALARSLERWRQLACGAGPVARRRRRLLLLCLGCWQQEMLRVVAFDRRAAIFAALALRRKALRAWKVRVLQVQHDARQLYKALAHFRRRWLCAGFAAWAEQVDLQTERLDLAVGHDRRRRLRKALGAWRWGATRLRQLEQLGAGVQGECLGRVKTQAWQRWRQRWRLRCRHQSILLRAVQRMRRRGLRQAWDAWALRVAGAQDARRKLGRALGHLRNRTLSLAWSEWVHSVVELKEQRRKMQGALHFLRGSALARHLLAWRGAAQRRRDLRSRGGQLALLLAKRQLLWAWNAWLQWAGARREKKQRLRRCIQLLQGGTCERAFAAWEEWVRHKAHRQSVLQAAVKRMLNRTLASAWTGWQEAMRCRTEMDAARLEAEAQLCLHRAHTGWQRWTSALSRRRHLKKVAARLLCGTAVRVLKHWNEAVALRLQRREVGRRCLLHMLDMRRGSAFNAWRAAVERKHELRERLRPVLQRMQNGLLSQAFNAFRANASTQASKRSAAVRALLHIANSQMARSWARWTEAVQEMRELRSRLGKAAVFFTNRQMALAWNRWKEQLLWRKEARARASSFVVMMRQRELTRAFRTWQDMVEVWAEEKGVIARALAHMSNRSLSAAFFTWREAAAEQRLELGGLRAALAHWRAGAMAKCFFWWQSTTVHNAESRTKLSHMLGKLMNQRLWAAWSSWQAYTWQRRELRVLTTRALGFRAHRLLLGGFDNLKEHVLERKKVLGALGHWVAKTLVRAWRRWHLYLVLLAELQQRLRTVQAHMLEQDRAEAFYALVEYCNWRRVRRAQTMAAAVHRGSRQLTCAWHGFLLHWEHKAKCRLAAAHHQGARLQAALQAWAAAASQQRLMRSKMERAVRRWSHATAGSCFLAWQVRVSEKQELRGKLRRAVALWSQRLLVEVLQEWHAAVCKHRRALRLWVNLAMAKAFSTWRSCLDERAARLQKMDAIARRMMFRELAWGFDAFKENVAFNAKVRAAVRRWMGSLLARTFWTWRANARDEQHHQQLLSRAVAHFRLGALAPAFYAWCDHAEEAPKLRRAIAWLGNRALSMAWNTWRENLLGKADRRAAKQRALSFWVNRQAAAALVTWRDGVRHRRRCREVVASCLLRMQQRHLSAAWQTWTAAVLEARDGNQKLLKALAWFRNQELCSALAGWKDAVQHRKWQRQCVANILTKVVQKEQMKAFNTWKEAVLISQKEDAADSHRQRCLRAAGLAAFRQARLQGARKRNAQAHFRLQQRKLAWSGWLECVEYTRDKGREADTLQALLAVRRRRQILLNTWAAMAGWMRKQQRARALLAQVRSRTQREVFSAWHATTVRMGLTAHLLYRVLLRSLRLVFAAWQRRTTAKQQQLQVQNALVQALQDRPLLSRTAHRTMTRWAHLLQHLAFVQWLGAACKSVELRAKADAAQRHSCRQLLRKALVAFQVQLRQARLNRAARLFRAGRVLRLVLGGWADATTAAACTRRSLQKACAFRDRALSRSALAAWLEAATWQQRRRHLLARAYRALARRRLCLSFDAWRELAAYVGTLRHRLDSLYTRVMVRTRAESFYEWHYITQWQVYLKRCGARAALFRLKRLAARPFLEWRRLTAERHLQCRIEEQGAFRALKFWKNLLLARAWGTWVTTAATAREHRRVLAVCVNRMLHRRLAAAWQAWLQRVADAHHKRQLLRKAAAFLLQRCLACAFYSWLDRVVQQQQKQVQMHKVALRWTNRLLAGAFDAMRAFAAEEREKRGKIAHAIAFFINSTLGAAWNAWVAETRHRVACRQKVLQALLATDARVQSAAFSSWLRFARWRRKLKEGISRLVLRRYYTDLRNCFREWRLCVVWQRRSSQLLAKCIVRLQNRSLASAFATWQAWSHRQRLLRRAAARFAKGVMVRAWTSWLQYHSFCRMARAMDWDHQHCLLRCFRRWKLLPSVRREKDRQLARAALHFFATAGRRAFAGWRWCAHTQRAQRWLLASRDERTAVQRLSHWRKKAKACRFCWKLRLARAMHAWTEHVVYQKVLGIKMRGAIMRLVHRSLVLCFTEWRAQAQRRAATRLVWMRKQRALRDAVHMGDQIIRRKRRLLLLSCFSSWSRQVLLQQRLRRHQALKHLATAAKAVQAWRRYCKARAHKAEKLHAALRFCAVSFCSRALFSWRTIAHEQAKRSARLQARAVTHHFRRAAGAALRRWDAFTTLQLQRRAALRRALAIVCRAESHALLSRALAAWERHTAERLRLADRLALASEHRRHKLLQDVFSTWQTYAAAMAQEAEAGSPFLSPRSSRQDRRLVQRMAAMMGTPEPLLRGAVRREEQGLLDGLFHSPAFVEAQERAISLGLSASGSRPHQGEARLQKLLSQRRLSMASYDDDRPESEADSDAASGGAVEWSSPEAARWRHHSRSRPSASPASHYTSRISR